MTVVEKQLIAVAAVAVVLMGVAVVLLLVARPPRWELPPEQAGQSRRACDACGATYPPYRWLAVCPHCAARLRQT